MRLTELEPTFLVRKPGEGDKVFTLVDEIGGAEGIQFLCPVCFAKNGGRVGTHIVICWTPAVPATVSPSPGRWVLKGTGYDDLTLDAQQPGGARSVKLEGGCMAHFSVTAGAIT